MPGGDHEEAGAEAAGSMPSGRDDPQTTHASNDKSPAMTTALHQERLACSGKHESKQA